MGDLNKNIELNIMHVDMDAFFASVEQLDDPSIRGKPVIVGGTALGKRGVVSTASYEARKYGVHSAMPIIKAKKLCPHGIYVPGRHHRYAEISDNIFEIFYNYTPLVEKISIDEAFLDLTGCHRLFGDTISIGKKIKNEVKERTGLTASVGIAPNKFMAKMASDMEKPDGFVVIKSDEIDKILIPLPVGKLWGVGKKTEKILREKGIKTVGMLRKIPRSDLEKMFGKLGLRLYNLARGIDNRNIESFSSVKSISHEATFSSSLEDIDKIYAVLLELSQKVVRRLRKKQMKGSTVFIKIRYDNFETFNRSLTLKNPADDVDTVYRVGKSLMEENNLFKKPVRLVGIGLESLTDKNQQQLSLFSSSDSEERLSTTIDNIKDRFGEKSIRRARNLYYEVYEQKNKQD